MVTFNLGRHHSNNYASHDVIPDIIADLKHENAPNTLNTPLRPKPLRYSDGSSSYLSRSSWQSTKFGPDHHYSTGTIFEKVEENDARDIGTSNSLEYFKGARLNGSDKILVDDSSADHGDGNRNQAARWSSTKGKEKVTDTPPTGSLHQKEKMTLDSKSSEEESKTGDASQTPSDQATYPSPAKAAVILLSVYISIFLVALDRTIIGPAIPAITNQFRSLDDVGWYGSAYMLTSCGFILLYSRIYTFYATKHVFLSGIALFEIGSAICGAANSSLMLIVGRAVAGFGSSGIFTGAILILFSTVPLHKRPLFQGLFGACFGVASVSGPLLGGAFTGSAATWRWCFYINLPLGAITMLVVIFLLKIEEQKPRMETWTETIQNLDPIGTLLFLPGITCLLLALEWGAAEYAWSSPRVIALLVVFATLFTAFCAWQYYTRHTTATIPARVFLQRSVIFGGLSQFCVGATMLTASMYIPLWFQAIRSTSAIQSGIRMIPLVLSVVVGSISSGGMVQKLGYYTPFMIAGSCLMTIGAGLITTWTLDSSVGEWIGYQVLLGLGVGWTMQHPNLAIQVVLQKKDVPTGTALLSLCQTLGGAVFVAVGQSLFIDRFSTGLNGVSGINPDAVLHSGATSLRTAVPRSRQPAVLDVYNKALTQGPFFAAMIIACLSLPPSHFMEWRSVKEEQSPSPREPEVVLEDEEKALHRKDRDSNTTHTLSAFFDQEGGKNINASALAELEANSNEPALPAPSWMKFNRPSGNFSAWMTSAFNPDLKNDLKKLKDLRDSK